MQKQLSKWERYEEGKKLIREVAQGDNKTYERLITKLIKDLKI